MDLHSLINKTNRFKPVIAFFFAILLSGCVSSPPSDINNICNIFRQYPRWYTDSKDVERRWKIPVPVQMAIIHQESKFNARAKPPRQKLLWIIPWTRPSSAYGYAQALEGTWQHYKRNNGGFLSTRDDFGDAVDFIGWYANEANKRGRIPRTDAYLLYLAYHEGVGGYLNKSYLKKPWLIQVARKVKAKSELYSMQLNRCQGSIGSKSWF